MLRKLSLILSGALVLMGTVFAGDRTSIGPDVVYVTTAEKGYLVRIDNLEGQEPAQTAIPLVGIEPRKVVFGPDAKLYLFDPDNGTIGSVLVANVSSWEPVDPPLNIQKVYPDPEEESSSLHAPEDGWFDHEGSLYVVDRALRSVIYKFPGLATNDPQPLETVNLGAFSIEGAGISMTRLGDLLILDRVGGRVLMVPFPAPSPVHELITGLADPIALDRSSEGEIYIADGDRIKRFDIDGALLSDCFRFRGRNEPTALQFNLGDQLFVTTEGQRGRLWRIDTVGGVCSEAQLVAEVAKPDKGGWPPAAGVSFPPTAVEVSKPVDPTQLFNFNSSAFELTVPSGCTAKVTARQILPAELNDLLTNELSLNTEPDCDTGTNCARLAIPLGERGFGLFHLVEPSGCGTTGYEFLQFMLTQFLSNPRSIKCDDTCFDPGPPDSCECQLAEFASEDFEFRGYYPFNVTLGEPDPILRGRGNNFSGFLAADIGLLAETGVAEFCGFLSPLNGSIRLDNFDPEDPPAGLPVVDSGDTLPAKFRLASVDDGGQCPDGPYLPNVQALIAVAQIWDGVEAVFEPIDVQPTNNSNEFDILFRSENNQYIYNLDTTGYEPGIYSLTVTFLGHNTAAETTFFRVD